MSAIWIEKLRAASSKAERDEILLWELKNYRRDPGTRHGGRLADEVEEQLRALADLAFPTTVL